FDGGRLQRIDRHFARYVDDGRLPGWLLLVSRGGKVVHLATCGQRDLEAALPVEIDTIWRIYSLTEPITSVAATMLYAAGAFVVGGESRGRLAAPYTPGPTTGRGGGSDAMGAMALRPPSALSGGGGLVSTAADYHRFTQMLLRGGELDGVRLLGPRTVRYMT